MAKRANVKQFIQKFSRVLNPTPPVGGLVVSDSALQFALIRDGKKVVTSSLRLPPNIITDGKVKDKVNFRAALIKLRSQIPAARGPVNIVLVLPAPVVSAQSFFAPFLSEERLNETARLNLQMISPISFDHAYASWQKIGERFTEGGEVELLGAFTESAVVDVYTSALESSGFSIVAVEFPSLAFTRLLEDGAIIKEDGEASLVIETAADGLALMLLGGKNLRFSYFRPWRMIQEATGEKQLSKEAFMTFLSQEVQKLVNFNMSRWGGALTRGIVAAPGMEAEIASFIEHIGFNAVKLSAAPQFPNVPPSWFVALGAAIRGQMSREFDTLISLTNASVQVRFRETRTLHFVVFWRRIIIAVLGFLVLVFAGFDAYLARRAAVLNVAVRDVSERVDVSSIETLDAQAKNFNELVTLALKAREYDVRWAPFFRLLASLSGADISVTSVKIEQKRALIIGSAPNESAILAFKDKMFVAPQFTDVSLPLSELKPNIDGSISFTMTFALESLEF